MGLAIDGNEVHGLAKGGQAFLPYSNKLFDFSKAAFGTKIYFPPIALIGETKADNDHFVVNFRKAYDIAGGNDNFDDCRITGATYISEDNIGPDYMGSEAGLYYLFDVYAHDSSRGGYYPKGDFLIRADQVIFNPGIISSSMMKSSIHAIV